MLNSYWYLRVVKHMTACWDPTTGYWHEADIVGWDPTTGCWW